MNVQIPCAFFDGDTGGNPAGVHLANTIDKSQEMLPTVLNKQRLLSSTDLDSKNLLRIIISGDGRLNNNLRKHM